MKTDAIRSCINVAEAVGAVTEAGVDEARVELAVLIDGCSWEDAAKEKIAALEADNAALRERVTELEAEVGERDARIAQMEAES